MRIPMSYSLEGGKRLHFGKGKYCQENSFSFSIPEAELSGGFYLFKKTELD